MGINLIKAAPFQINVSCVGPDYTPTYPTYLKCLPAFVQAQLFGKSIRIDKLYWPLSPIPQDITIPFASPHLCVSFEKLTSSGKERLDTMGFTSSRVKGRDIYAIRDPTSSTIALVKELQCIKTTPVIYSFVNAECFNGYKTSVRIISAVAHTQSYARYQNNDHMIESLADQKQEEDRSSSSKRPLDTEEANVEQGHPKAQKSAQGQDALTTPRTKDVELKTANFRSRALPTYLSQGECPSNFDGLYFAYIQELALDDKHTVPEFINRHMFTSLGANAGECFTRMDSLRGAWGQAGTSRAGKELTHFTKVLDIALSVQSVAIPVFEKSQYYGAILLGAGYMLAIGKNQYQPLPYNDLKRLVRATMTDHLILDYIASQTKKAFDEDMEEITMRKLKDYLLDTDLPKETQTEVKKIAARLTFARECLTPNPPDVARIYRLIADPSLPCDDLPVHYSMLFEPDRTKVLLSAFGVMQVPSPQIPEGNSYALDASSPPPDTMYYRLVTVAQAFADLSVIKANKSVQNNPKNAQNVRSRYRQVKDADKRDLWRSLNGFVYDDEMKEVLVSGQQSNRLFLNLGNTTGFSDDI